MEGEQKEQATAEPKEVYETREGVRVKPLRKVFPQIDKMVGVPVDEVTKSNTVVAEALKTGKPVSATLKQGK